MVDVLTESIKKGFYVNVFANDIIPLAESREEINVKLEIWRNTLESKGFRLSRSKTEYMHCNFANIQRRGDLDVKLGNQIIPQVTKFKYLESILLQQDGEIDDDVNHRIHVGYVV